MDRSLASALKLASGLGALIIAQAFPAQAASPADPAPESSAATDSKQLDEILVTARRTKENLISVPIAVTALSAAQLETRGVSDLISLQDFTPGFRKVNMTFNRNDRGYQTFVMRGIYGGDGAPRQPVRVFIDGTPIISGDVAGFDALERVEVVEGPQSAYFGRSTFAGAVNFVTRTPGFVPKVSGSAQYSSFNSYQFRAAVEGPLIKDVLSARLSGYYNKDGAEYDNFGLGTRLGEQKTKSASLNVLFKPFDGVRIKAFEQIWENNDGPGAQALLGSAYYNCNAGGAPAGTLNYTCGKISSVPQQALFFNIQQFSPQTIAGVTSGDVVYYLPGNFITKGGLRRKANQGLVSAEIDLPQGWMLAANASYLQDRWSNLIDGYQQPTTLNRLLSTPQHLRGTSTEARVSSPELFGHLKVSVGANYLYQNVLASAPGTLGTAVVFFSNPALYVGKTTGIFGTVHYDFNSKLFLDLEGRYQWDNVRQAIIVRPQSLAGSVPVDVSDTFKSFTPKATLSYKIEDNVLTYVSYSKGTRPGEFNVSTYALPASQRDALIAQSNLQLELGPEKLDMYEVGVKGEFLDRRLRVIAAGYYGDWKKRHVTSQILIPGTTAFVTPITNQGKVDLYGVEITATGRITSALTLEGTLGFNESKIKNTFCTACLSLTGNGTPSGTRLPAYPAWTWSISPTYTHAISAEADAFIRFDYIHTGHQYDTESNLTYTTAANRLNVRVGVQKGAYGIEVFARNITNDKTPNSIFRSANALQGGNALVLSPPERPIVGVKLSVKG